MMLRATLLLLAFVLMTGCASQEPPSSPNARTSKEPKSKPASRGRVAHGVLATYYDRNADGVYEEAQRAKHVYYDRNGDGIVDFVERDGAPIRTLEWDADYDGILDHSIVSEEGYIHRWTNKRSISKSAPRIFREDGIKRRGTCELSAPKYEFWELILGLKSKEELEKVPGAVD